MGGKYVLVCLGLMALSVQAKAATAANTSGETTQAGDELADPATSSATIDIPLTLSTHAAWSGTYMLNAAFLAEYEARRLSFGDRDQEYQIWLNSPDGRALYQRARFALQAMTQRSQTVTDPEGWQDRLATHAKVLKPAVGPINEATIAATLPEEQRKFWQHWQVLYALPAPTCPLSAEKVQEFVAGLAQAKTAGGESAQATIARLQGWPAPRVRCLALTLSATHGTDAQKGPLTLLQALQVMDSPLLADTSIRAIFSLTLLRHGNFPETLRVLMSMLDQQPAYRLPYEIVQRVFSIRHQGRGRVALQGL